jgi:outer membrane protein assembly factor BamB
MRSLTFVRRWVWDSSRGSLIARISPQLGFSKRRCRGLACHRPEDLTRGGSSAWGFLKVVWWNLRVDIAVPTKSLGIGVAVSALLLNVPIAAAQTDWATFGFDPQRTGYNTQETILSPSNVATMQLNWFTNLGGPSTTQPTLLTAVPVVQPDGSVVPFDLVYVASQYGVFYAIDAHSGTVIWSDQMPTSQVSGCPDVGASGGVIGVIGTPAIDRANNRIFVVAGDDTLHALDPATGAELVNYPVQLVGPANAAPRSIVWSGLTYNPGNNSLYIATAGVCDTPPYHGQLMRVNVTPGATPKVARRWFPTISNFGPNGGGIWGWGGASVAPAGHPLFVGTGNALANPENQLFADHVVSLGLNLSVLQWDGPDLGFSQGLSDVDLGSTPTLFQPPGCQPELAVMAKNGKLYIYNRNAINNGPLQTITITQPESGFLGDAAYDPILNQLYVGSPRDDGVGTFFHGLIALLPQADCTFALAWQQQLGLNQAHTWPAPPIAANGVVYFATGVGAQVFALDATSGQVLWVNGDPAAAPIFTAPTVANGQLFVVGYDNNLYAYGLPPTGSQ